MEKGQQWEMDLYERAVAIMGEDGVHTYATNAMVMLRRGLADCVGENRLKKVAKYRASVEIALNLLHVLMGDVSEEEMQGLEELEEMVCACED